MPDKAASVDQKQNSEKWKKMTDEQNAKPTANIIVTEGDRPKKPMAGTVNSETLVAQTQERLSRVLKRRYQYETNLKPAQEFPSGHTNATVTIYTSASEAKTGGFIFSILQLAVNNFFTSVIDLSSDDKVIFILYLPFGSVETIEYYNEMNQSVDVVCYASE